jgi:hypothetical protein
MSTDDLRASLRAMSEGFRKLGAAPGAWLIAEFVLREGVDCNAQALPSRYPQRPPKLCFANTAALLWRAGGLTYVEGFIVTRHVPFPVHHAWAIDAHNGVIDTTIEEPETCRYVGVRFSREDYLACTRIGNSASALLDEVGCVRADFMLARCPDLRALMPAERV